jgi:hypothetical protein
MKTPRTRVDEATTELERELLRSWASEAPSRTARRRALGIAVGTAGAAAAGSATGATAGAAGAGIANSVAPKATAAALVAAAKWFAAGAVIVTGALVARPHLRAPARPPEPVSLTQASAAARPGAPVGYAPAAASSAPQPAVAPPAPEPVVAPAAPASRPAAHRMARPKPTVPERPAAAPAAPAVESTEAIAPPPAAAPEPKRAARELGEQVAALDRAERALASGDAALALSLVEEYEQRFPAGSLLQEATVVRVDALSKLGRREAAAEVGRAFLASHPTSPYAAKVRRRLESGSIP